MGFLNGKKLLITGVISNRSIAYGIAKACRREGAELAFTYANERYRERIEGLAAAFDSKLVYRMDVGSDEDIAAVVEELGKAWGGLDGFVHSIGFAPREAIAGDFLEGLSRESFKIAMDISAYSYPAMAKAFLPLMKGRQASVLTLTYLGSERVVPNYNTMGLPRRHSSRAPAIWPPASAGRAFARTPSPQVPSRRLPLPAFRTSASFCT